MTRIPARHVQHELIRPPGVEPDAVVTVLRVPPESSGMRLDRFVMTQLRHTSRTQAKRIITRCAYDETGTQLRASNRVRPEQWVLLWRPPWDEEVVPLEIPVLYEDHALFVIDKPAGVPVHPTARYYRSTVVKRLEAAYPNQRLVLGHRLDRETSGVLLLTKGGDWDRRVKRIFAGCDPASGRPSPEPLVDKTYLAIVHGCPQWSDRRLDAPVELSIGGLYRNMMRIAAPDTGLSAITDCAVVETRFRPSASGGSPGHEPATYSLIRCELRTGRQHQIRLHLAHAGHPIVGDKLYGADPTIFGRASDGELRDEDREALELERHALHAHRLSIVHPDSRERTVVEAPLARDLQAFWDQLEPRNTSSQSPTIESNRARSSR